MKKIKFLYFAIRQPEYFKIGKVPSVVFYGTDQFRKDDAFEFSVCWKRGLILRLLNKPLEWYVIRRLGIGFRLDQAIIHLRKIRNQDVVFAETDSAGLPLLFLKRLGLLKCRIGFNSAGLINNLVLQKHTKLFFLYKWMLQSADFIVCWSPVEQKMYQTIIKANAHFILLESDVDFYISAQRFRLEDFVLCVGRDVGRDFETLFEALEIVAVPTKIITSLHRVSGLKIPRNVEMIYEKVEYSELLQFYRRARFVIVSLQEIHRFTGQRAMLESLSMGKATLLAKTEAVVSTYDLVEGKDVVFYEPGNSQDLAMKISELYSEDQRLIELGLSGRRFVESLPKNAYYLGVRRIILSFFADKF